MRAKAERAAHLWQHSTEWRVFANWRKLAMGRSTYLMTAEGQFVARIMHRCEVPTWQAVNIACTAKLWYAKSVRSASLRVAMAQRSDAVMQAEAFAGWLAWHRESATKRRLLLSSVQSLQQGALGRAFRSWATHSVEHARLRSMAASCLARMQHAVQHRAFACWQKGAHGAAEAR